MVFIIQATKRNAEFGGKSISLDVFNEWDELVTFYGIINELGISYCVCFL